MQPNDGHLTRQLRLSIDARGSTDARGSIDARGCSSFVLSRKPFRF